MVLVKIDGVIKNVISRFIADKQTKKIQTCGWNRFIGRILQNGSIIKFIYGRGQSLRRAQFSRIPPSLNLQITQFRVTIYRTQRYING